MIYIYLSYTIRGKLTKIRNIPEEVDEPGLLNIKKWSLIS